MKLCVVQASPGTAEKIAMYFTISEIKDIIELKCFNFPDDEDDLDVEWEHYLADS